MTFEVGMVLWLDMMQKDTGYDQPPVIDSVPISFNETLRSGGTCRVYGATYRGEKVVAKLYKNYASATEKELPALFPKQQVAAQR